MDHTVYLVIALCAAVWAATRRVNRKILTPSQIAHPYHAVHVLPPEVGGEATSVRSPITGFVGSK